MAFAAGPGADAKPDKPVQPQLPLAQWWSVKLEGPVGAAPASDPHRVYLALQSAHLIARDASDGHELWRQPRDVKGAMAVDGDLLFVPLGDAIEAFRGPSGQTAWLLPRVKAGPPLVAGQGWLVAITEAEVLAIRPANGEIAWRHAAGGVRVAPAIDEARLYVGADDGRVAALNLKDGSVAWEAFVDGGVTALAAYGGRVYVGAGDKFLYCLDAAKGSQKWPFRLGALAAGRIAVDDEHVYVASLDNEVRGLDRHTGNQRWHYGLRQRPALGVIAVGHVVFVPAEGNALPMFFDGNGKPSGTLALPGDAPPLMVPDVQERDGGPVVFAVTGGLTNEWSLTKFARAGDVGLVTLADMPLLPGVRYQTDPVLAPIGNVLGRLLLDDPPLIPVSQIGWPLVMQDPPLAPLTVVPGVQLRPLSPVLPVRREARGPGG